MCDAMDRRKLAAIGFLALLAVLVALVTQHYFDMQPCPWCIVQRMSFMLIALIALAAAAWPAARGRGVYAAAAIGIAVLAILGAASALWQQVYAAKSSSCARTLADQIIGATSLDRLWPDVFEARASCAEASVPLLGLPYPIWSLLLFLVIAIFAARLHLEQRARVPMHDAQRAYAAR